MSEARRSSSGVGSSPAISVRIASALASSASLMSGLPPETASESIPRDFPETSAHLAITVGVDSLTARRSSRLAPSSPSSTRFSRRCNSRIRSLTASESSSIVPFTSAPPFSVVVVVAARHEGRPRQHPSGLAYLEDGSQELFQALPFGQLLRPALLAAEAYRLVGVGEELRYLPSPHVLFFHPLTIAHAPVVVEVPVSSLLPGHFYVTNLRKSGRPRRCSTTPNASLPTSNSVCGDEARTTS